MIARAIESALFEQDLADVLVVDDSSTDRTAEIAAAYDRVTVIRCEGRGIVDANNTALRHARGDVVIHLDADDRLVPGAVALLLEPFSDPDVALVSGGSLVDDGERVIDSKVVFPSHAHLAVACMALDPFPHSGTSLRRDAILGLGGYRSSGGIDVGEDYDLWLRLFDTDLRCVGIPRTVVRQTLRREGVTGSRYEQFANRSRQEQLRFRSGRWERRPAVLVDLGHELNSYDQGELLRDRWSALLVVLAARFMRDGRVLDAGAVLWATMLLGPLRMVKATVDRRRRMSRHRRVLGR